MSFKLDHVHIVSENVDEMSSFFQDLFLAKVLSYDENLKKGEDIYLTLNINLQNASTNALSKTINKFSAESGSIIIMDIANSEILSLVNYPDFDSNNVNDCDMCGVTSGI